MRRKLDSQFKWQVLRQYMNKNKVLSSGEAKFAGGTMSHGKHATDKIRSSQICMSAQTNDIIPNARLPIDLVLF